MTKYILHGGYAGHVNSQNDEYFKEVLKSTSGKVNVLLVYFAKELDRIPKNQAEDVFQFEHIKGNRQIKFDIAEEQKLKRNWPKNAASLVKRIKKLSHNLQEMGIKFRSSSLGKSRMISIKIDESLSLSKSPTDCLRYPVSEANPNEKEITTPMSSLPDEVQRWDECLQEFFCTRSGSYMDDGMSIEESNLYAMEDVKNSPEYLIYQKTIGVNC